MLKKVLVAGLMLTVMLSASACGKEPSGTSGTAVDTPVESSTVESQPTEETTDEGTESTAGDASQPTEEAEEEAECSYIFSDMPIAAYEITGWGVDPDIPVYDKNIIDPEDGYDYGVMEYVQLTPSENTFVLYCFSGGDDSNNGADYGVSLSTVHSPSGSSPWEANYYSCLDGGEDLVPEGWVWIVKYYGGISEADGGRFISMVDPWHYYIRFSEIFHSDASEPDTIHVIEVETFVDYHDGHETEEDVILKMIAAFEERGATVKEISVEEAMAKDKIIVAEDSEN